MSIAPTTAQSVDAITEHVATATDTELPALVDNLRKTISNYPSDIIEQLAKAVAQKQLPYTISLLISEGDKSYLIREALCFIPHLPDMPGFRALVFLKSLHHHTQLPPLDDYSANETTRKQCIALMIVINGIYDRIRESYNLALIKRNPQSGSIETLGGDGLVELVLQRPEDAARIVDIIVARKTGDAEMIRQVLNHETPALAEGAL